MMNWRLEEVARNGFLIDGAWTRRAISRKYLKSRHGQCIPMYPQFRMGKCPLVLGQFEPRLAAPAILSLLRTLFQLFVT